MIEKLCCQSVSKEGDNWVVFPSATCNALFLISHLVKHFVHSNLEYRQLVDWGLFVRRYHKDIDWEEVRNELIKVGLYRFMCAANMACISYLGLSGLYVPETIVGDDQRIMMPYWNNGSGIRNFAAHYMNRERSRLLSNEHWLRATIRSIGYRMKIKKKQY